MDFEKSMREAALRADKAVNMAMRKYGRGEATDEDDITGVLIGNLDTSLEGQIGDLIWSTSIVRHRRGKAAEEKRIGADIVIHVRLDARDYQYSKGVLVQAKRVEPSTKMAVADHSKLVEQCNKMLNNSPASFVFNYAKSQMRCASAIKIAGSSNRELYADCSWTSYRFFLELFRCPIGDPRFTNALVQDLPVPTAVEMKAVGG